MRQVTWWLTLKDVDKDASVGYYYDPRIYFCAIVSSDRSVDPPVAWRIETDGGETLAFEMGCLSGRLDEIDVLTYASPVHLVGSLVDESVMTIAGVPVLDISRWPRLPPPGPPRRPHPSEQFVRTIECPGRFTLGIDTNSLMMRLSDRPPSKFVVTDAKLYVGFDEEDRLCYVECRSVEESVTSSIRGYFETRVGW